MKIRSDYLKIKDFETVEDYSRPIIDLRGKGAINIQALYVNGDLDTVYTIMVDGRHAVTHLPLKNFLHIGDFPTEALLYLPEIKFEEDFKMYGYRTHAYKGGPKDINENSFIKYVAYMEEWLWED